MLQKTLRTPVLGEEYWRGLGVFQITVLRISVPEVDEVSGGWRKSRIEEINDLLRWHRGTAVARWLRYCATNRKVAGSIPDGVLCNFSAGTLRLP
jgi:hypothetical protein